ncbi:uncharacterized protein [Apostichopus japonicus]|uniref:uncharacterized protein n=1 Tax=Stichopus japonicus TaxID=307972 RepID=UPI003AB566E8
MLKQEVPLVRRVVRDWKKLHNDNGLLYRRVILGGHETLQLCLPQTLKETVLKSLHDEVGHQSPDQTLQLIQKRCFWPGMVVEFTDYCQKCQRCSLAKAMSISMEKESYRPEINELRWWQRFLLRIGSLGLECRSDCTVTKGETLRVVSFDICASCMVFTNPGHSVPSRGGMLSVNVSTALCAHDRLRILSADKRRSWPSHLLELIYAYNATPHSSTGYAPHYLFFGREPALPVDHLLGIEIEDSWVENHQSRLNRAFEAAAAKTNSEMLRRIQRLDNQAQPDTDLQLGTRVFTRKRHLSRHKIQDTWDDIPHKVISRPDPDGPVYVVQL